MKLTVVLLGLGLILLANIVMMYFAPYGVSPLEGFQNAAAAMNNASAPMNNAPAMNGSAINTSAMTLSEVQKIPHLNALAMPMVPSLNGATAANLPTQGAPGGVEEGFASYALANAGGAKDSYQAIGAFDGIKLSTGNSVSGWRYTAPNEPLMGAEFAPGPDALFMFKNNQCKPECCGASFSCGGGCVCTTPQQRQYIASRGGNRTAPEDSA